MPCGKFAAAGSPRATASVVYDAAERKPMEITDMAAGRHASRKHHRISARLPFTLYYAALALALLWLSVCCTVTDAAPALVFLGTGFSLNASTRLWDRQTRCPSGQTSCGGSCVNLQTSANHCGSCANECLQVPYPNQQIWCSGGECQSRCVIPTCDPGEILAYGRQNPCAFCRPCENTLLYNCGSSTEVGQHNCVNRNTDNRNCGSCGNACPFSTMCTNGVCRSTDPCAGINCGSFSSCSGGRCSCNSGYSSPSGDGRNCQLIDPCAGINCGPFSSCSAGRCSCNSGYSSPSGDGRNCQLIDRCAGVNCGDFSSCSGGTCTCNPGYSSSTGDGKNCRAIDPCAGINCGDFSSCSGGTCSCNPGYTSPSGNGRACVPVDPCRGVTCPSGQVCSNGACACASGLTSCGGSCVSLDSDSRNCGACGTSCPDGQSCSSRRCLCPTGLTNCNGFCVAVDSDRNHCGQCGTSCPADSMGCSSGTCQFRPTCGTGQTNCGTASSLNCVTLDSDIRNCGKCGSLCPSGQICSSGTCGSLSGFTACGSACVATSSDINHCGRCNNACGSGATGCANGVCQIPVAPSPSPSPPPATTTTTSSSVTTTKTTSATTSSSTSASTTTATLVFATAPTAVPALSGATPMSLSAGSRISLTVGSRGLSCDSDCVLADGSSGEYAVAGVAGSPVIRLQRGSSCLQARQSGVSLVVSDGSCPTSPARLLHRQAGGQLFPYWALFNSSSGSLMILNANMDASSGCLQASSGSSVSLGSCSSAAAAQWNAPGSTTGSATSSSSSSNIPAIVGGVVGGIVVIAAAGGIAVYVKRKKARPAATDVEAEKERRNGSPATDDSVSTLADDSSDHHKEKHNEAQPLATRPEMAQTAVVDTVPIAQAVGAARPQPAKLSEPELGPVGSETTSELPTPALLPAKGVTPDSAGSKTASVAGSGALVSPSGRLQSAAPSSAGSKPGTPGNAARPSGGSGAGGVAIAISPSASKLLVTEDEIAIDRAQRLGEGGFGVVYVGTLRGSTKVAVKTIKGDLDERTMAAFVKEVANWEGLVQRNVLPLMAFCISPPMMVMDLIEEGNLRKYLGSLGWDQALGRRFLHDVTAGMAYLHASGILHGDLKSLNVLVDGSRAVITDFGLSRVRLEVSKSSARTGNGMQGTPGFVAPEMLAGGPLKPAGDVYAFAMLCYEVVSKGRYPFDDLNSIAAIVYKVAVEQLRPERPDGVQDAMWAMMECAWAQDPQSRPDFVELEKETAKLML